MAITMAKAHQTFKPIFILHWSRGSVNPHVVYSFIRDAEITDNNLLNSSVTNGIVALYTAYQDHKNLSTLTSIEIEEALDSFKKIYPNIEVSQDNLKEKLYKKQTALFLAKILILYSF